MDYRNLMCFSCKDMQCVTNQGEYRYPDKFTFCYRSKAQVNTNPSAAWSSVVSFGRISEDWSHMEEAVQFGVWETGSWLGMKNANMDSYSWVGLGEERKDIPLLSWRHICFTVDLDTGGVSLFENGKLTWRGLGENLIPVAAAFKPTFTFVSAGCIYRNEGVSGYMSMHGEITDVQMFSSVLPDQELEDITGCRLFKKGNIVNWMEEEWNMNGTKSNTFQDSRDIDVDICGESSTSLHFLPFKQVMKPDVMSTCSKMSGRAAGYTDEISFRHLSKFLSDNKNLQSKECSTLIEGTEDTYKLTIFTSNSDDEQETVWRDLYDKDRIVSYLPWAPNRPYAGGTKYNCMTILYDFERTDKYLANLKEVALKDEECGVFVDCAVCQVSGPVLEMKVRGLCKFSTFVRKYTYSIQDDGTPIWIGIKSSAILYIQSEDRWEWYDRKNNASVALINSPANSLVLGLQKVDFSTAYDTRCFKEEDEKIIKLKFSTCKPGEYTCDDARCIDSEQRCDQTSNCLDGSDEINCRMIIQKDNYNKKIAPFKFDRDLNQNIPVVINISVSIRDILKIEEINHIFIVKYVMIMEWYDYRLEYYNLKVNRSMNSFSSDELDRVWIPFVIFDNTEKNEATKGDEDTEMTVTREGEFTRSDDTVPEEINIFNGEDNRITFSRVYSKTFKCEYLLQLYPFDTQTCTIDMKIRESQRTSVEIAPDMILMDGKTDLTQYIVTNWELDYINSTNPSEGLNLIIVMKRRIMNEIMTTYLPTILILIIVYTTNFFKDFFFEAVVTVNLTALLVLTTLFISVSDSLPQTAYVKMVDIWLIFAQLIPFFEVLLHTFMDNMRQEGEREINHHGKAITVGGDSDNSKNGLFDSTSSRAKLAFMDSVSPTVAEMVDRDEKKLVDARKKFYEAQIITDWVKFGEFVSRIVIPFFILTFSFVYWTYGLTQYLSTPSRN